MDSMPACLPGHLLPTLAKERQPWLGKEGADGRAPSCGHGMAVPCQDSLCHAHNLLWQQAWNYWEEDWAGRQKGWPA